jgi:hypothetical protein
MFFEIGMIGETKQIVSTLFGSEEHALQELIQNEIFPIGGRWGPGITNREGALSAQASGNKTWTIP